MKIVVFADHESGEILPMMNLYVMDGEVVLTGITGRTTNALIHALGKLRLMLNSFLMFKDPISELKYDKNTNTFYWEMDEVEQIKI